MLAKTWRTAQGLSLNEAADLFGGLSRQGVYRIERGLVWPTLATIIRIDCVTGGAVSFGDHLTVWRAAHKTEFKALQREGRAAARRLKARSPTDRTANGKG